MEARSLYTGDTELCGFVTVAQGDGFSKDGQRSILVEVAVCRLTRARSRNGNTSEKREKECRYLEVNQRGNLLES